MRRLTSIVLALALAGCGRDDGRDDHASGRTARALVRAAGDALMPWRVLRMPARASARDIHVLRADPDRDVRMLERAIDRLCECSSDACRLDARREYDLDRRVLTRVPAFAYRALDERAERCR